MEKKLTYKKLLEFEHNEPGVVIVVLFVVDFIDSAIIQLHVDQDSLTQAHFDLSALDQGLNEVELRPVGESIRERGEYLLQFFDQLTHNKKKLSLITLI